MEKIVNIIEKFFKTLSKREKTLLDVTLFILLLLMLDRLILIPIIKKLSNLEEEIQQKEVIVRDSFIVLGSKKRIISEYRALKDYFIEDRKSQEEELAELLRHIETMAASTDVYINSIKAADDPEDTPLYTKYEITLNCTGSIKKVAEFMYDIGYSQELVKITMLGVKVADKESDIAKCSMTISKLIVSSHDII